MMPDPWGDLTRQHHEERQREAARERARRAVGSAPRGCRYISPLGRWLCPLLLLLAGGLIGSLVTVALL